MQTIEQKTIEYLLKRVQELEKENQQLKNKIHEDFVRSLTKPIIIKEELIERLENEWNRTPTFKGKPQTQQNVSLQDALEAGIGKEPLHPDYIQLTSEEKIEKGDIVEDSDPNFRELLIGQRVGSRKVWRINHLIFRDLSKEEIIRKDDIVFNEDYQRYIEAYLLDGEEVRDRKVKRKITN